jgi:hypothetical protein
MCPVDMGELTKLLKSFLTRLTQQSPRTNLVAEISPEKAAADRYASCFVAFTASTQQRGENKIKSTQVVPCRCIQLCRMYVPPASTIDRYIHVGFVLNCGEGNERWQ